MACINSDTTACPTELRKELYPWQWIGATANALQDCETFIEKEVDYIYLAPFRATENTQSTVLGLNGFTAILEALQTDTPIIGVGGITTTMLKPFLKPVFLELGFLMKLHKILIRLKLLINYSQLLQLKNNGIRFNKK